HDVAREPRAGRAACPDRSLRLRSARCAHTQLAVVEDADRAGVCAEQALSLLDHFVEDGLRIELGGEQASRPCQLLGERAGAALRLVQLAALERAARRASEMLSELEVVLAERVRLLKEDGDETARSV